MKYYNNIYYLIFILIISTLVNRCTILKLLHSINFGGPGGLYCSIAILLSAVSAGHNENGCKCRRTAWKSFQTPETLLQLKEKSFSSKFRVVSIL
jgi:hypothetical protein